MLKEDARVLVTDRTSADWCVALMLSLVVGAHGVGSAQVDGRAGWEERALPRILRQNFIASLLSMHLYVVLSCVALVIYTMSFCRISRCSLDS